MSLGTSPLGTRPLGVRAAIPDNAIVGNVIITPSINSTMDFTQNASIVGDVSVTPIITSAMVYSAGNSISGDITVTQSINATMDFTQNASISGNITVNQTIAATMDYTQNASIAGDVIVTPTINSTMAHTSGNSIAGDVTISVAINAAMNFTQNPSITGDISITPSINSVMRYVSSSAVSANIKTGAQMFAKKNDTAFPITVAVDSTGGISGLTVTAAIRNSLDNNSYLDFDDNTFKTSGWVQKTITLTDLGSGFYASQLNLNIITNIPNAGHFIIEYDVNGSVVAIDSSIISFDHLSEEQDAQLFGLGREVYIDTEQVAAGDGSQSSPFNDLTNAIDYAELIGCKNLVVYSDITLDRNLKNFVIRGVGTPTVDCNGQDLTKSEFWHCAMQGNYIGAITVQESILLNNFWLNGFFEKVALAGNLFCVDGASVFMMGNGSAIAGLGRPTISMNGAGSSKLSIRKNSGGLTIKDCNNATDEVTVEISEGSLTFDSSCTDGVMVARGMCKFVDSSNGATVVDETGNPANINIADKILRNKTETDPVTGVMTVYADDGVTVLFDANIWENVAATVPYAGNAVNRRDKLS